MRTDMSLPRRGLLQLIAGGGLALATPAAAAVAARASGAIRAPSAEAARMIWARLVADLSGRPVYFFTHGNVWGFKPQADDLTAEQFARKLYGYSGVAARRLVGDGAGGFMVEQKAWAFYRDAETDRITDRIANPYTGRIDTARPMSGKVSSRPLAQAGGAADPFALRIRRLGPTAVVETSNAVRFTTPDISWHKLEANLEDYSCEAAELDGGRPHLRSRYSQNLVAEWQTWTGMHGMPGHILFKGNGVPLTSMDEVPDDQLAAIEHHFPGTRADIRHWE